MNKDVIEKLNWSQASQKLKKNLPSKLCVTKKNLQPVRLVLQLHL